MMRMLAAVLTALLAVIMTLVAMLVLVRATIAVSLITHPVARAVAVVAELFLGVILLVGTIYLATHLGVRIFRRGPDGASR